MKIMHRMSAILVLLSAIACGPVADTAPAANPVTASPTSTATPRKVATASPRPTRTSSLSPIPSLTPTPTAMPIKCSPKPIVATSTKTPIPKPDYSVPRLTDKKLKNGTYFAPFADKSVTFIDGESETPPLYFAITSFAYGDLNSDGIEDAAMVLYEASSMWSAKFSTIHAILNRNGALFQSAYGFEFMDGGAGIIAISQGQIIAHVKMYGPGDGNCCPSIPAFEKWQLLSEDHLVLRSYFIAPNGIQQKIKIESPPEGTAVSCSVRMQGSISYQASEETLYYRVKRMTEEELAFGSFTIRTEGEKSGGTFDVSINLDMIPSGESILVSICDAACGYSMNAMDSVVLTVV